MIENRLPCLHRQTLFIGILIWLHFDKLGFTALILCIPNILDAGEILNDLLNEEGSY